MPLIIRVVPISGSKGYTSVEVNQQLQHRGSDFDVYANNGYQPEPEDSALLRMLMAALLTDDSAVSCVHVDPFTLSVVHNLTVTAEDIKSRDVGAARRVYRGVCVK